MTLPAGAGVMARLMTRLVSSSSETAGRTGAEAAGVATEGAATIGAAAGTGLRPSVVAGVAAGSPPARRRRASSSDCRLKLASCERRSSSSRLRASAASRSAFSRVSRSRRAAASASCRRRSSSSRARASTSARARASRCSSVKVCSTTPVLGGGGAAGRAAIVGPRGATGGAAGATAAAFGAAATGAGAAGAASRGATSPGPRTRRFFSTTTTLLRPCEKLCRTVPASTGRLRCKVAFGAEAPRDLSPLLFVSLMRSSSNPNPNMPHFGDFLARDRRAQRGRSQCRRAFARPISGQARDLGEKCRTRRPRAERCMYHICPPQCQIQLT